MSHAATSYGEPRPKHDGSTPGPLGLSVGIFLISTGNQGAKRARWAVGIQGAQQQRSGPGPMALIVTQVVRGKMQYERARRTHAHATSACAWAPCAAGRHGPERPDAAEGLTKPIARNAHRFGGRSLRLQTPRRTRRPCACTCCMRMSVSIAFCLAFPSHNFGNKSTRPSSTENAALRASPRAGGLRASRRARMNRAPIGRSRRRAPRRRPRSRESSAARGVHSGR